MTASTASAAAATAYIGLGTNVGERARNLATALEHLRQALQLQAVSSIYETEPVGYAEQPSFWNMVVQARTTLPPAELLARLIDIEQQMGRQRSFRNAPRVIDLDILLYGDIVHEEPGLRVPHPRMTERAFVLKPLVEVAPDLRDPESGRRYHDVLAQGEFERAEVVGTVADLKEMKP